MIKPDVIVVWPKHCDYPLFREFLRSNKDLFNKVIIAITQIESDWDFTEEIKALADEDTIVFNSVSFGDWRDAATNQALNMSEDPWVLFIEQDFFISRDELVKVFERDLQTGFKESERIHPGFLLVHKRKINNTSKNFEAKPPYYDHFGMFTQQIGDLEFLEPGTYRHMNGLTHNFTLCMRNEPQYIYKKDEFIAYLLDSVKVPVSDDYLLLVDKCLEVLNEDIR